VFSSGSFRIHEDLYLLSDQVFGWKNNYSIERKAGIEAVKAHPGKYFRGVGSTIWQQVSESYFRPLPSTSEHPETIVASKGRGLPPPTENQPIPGGQVVWISRPDNDIRQVWTSPTEFHLTFRTADERRRFKEIDKELRSLFGNMPHREGNRRLGLRLNQLSRWFPRSIIWIVVGLIALVWRRPRGSRTLIALALAAQFVIVFNALGLFADRRFALPVAPAFVLFGAAALLGPRAAARASRPDPAPR
jgi:hypothetical protein